VFSCSVIKNVSIKLVSEGSFQRGIGFPNWFWYIVRNFEQRIL
jgi:hypothetical protein